MFSETGQPARTKSTPLRFPFSRTAALLLISALAVACGHKAPPVPPPLRNPAATKDLTVQQRGQEFVLSFTYPQTTVSGTPLEPLQRIEVWELERPVPDWSEPTRDDEAEEGEDEVTATDVAPGEEDDDQETTGPFGLSSGAGDDPSLPDPSNTGEEADAGSAGGVEKGVDEADEEKEADDTGASEPVVRAPTKEELIAVERAEFAATAAMRVTYEEAAVEASSLGERILLTLPIDRPSAEGDPASEDGSVEMGSVFAVKTGISPKLMSGFSNIVAIVHRTPPDPPTDFEIEPEQTRVTIRWEAAGDADVEIVGYHVHRREAQNPRYGLPLAFVPVTDPAAADAAEEDDDTDVTAAPESPSLEYVDRSATLGQRYIYALTTVSNREPLVESAITVEQELDYADRFAPRSPSKPIALAETGRIRLLWDASPASDLEGYFVDRRELPGEWERLNDEPILTTEFSDRDIVSGRTYSYRVVAVDRSANESDPAGPVDVAAP